MDYVSVLLAWLCRRHRTANHAHRVLP
jgi:hypothetical protein